MSKKGVNTTSDYLEFDRALNKGTELLSNKPKIGLYIITSIHTGLRVSDVLSLTWGDLSNESFEIVEKKTNKRKSVKVHPNIKKALSKVVRGANSEKVFISQKGSIYSTQQINRVLKGVFNESNKFNISSHSLRKTFGRRVYFMQGESERALIYLSEIFNHTSLSDTRKYLGIRQEEINDIYLSI